MKVKELIKLLKKFEEGKEILIYTEVYGSTFHLEIKGYVVSTGAFDKEHKPLSYALIGVSRKESLLIGGKKR